MERDIIVDAPPEFEGTRSYISEGTNHTDLFLRKAPSFSKDTSAQNISDNSARLPPLQTGCDLLGIFG